MISHTTACVCRAGGKLSIGFPPETRRAENHNSYTMFDIAPLGEIQLLICWENRTFQILKSSLNYICSKLFSKVDMLVENLKLPKIAKSTKPWKRALLLYKLLARAETWLTVHRALPYRTGVKWLQPGPAKIYGTRAVELVSTQGARRVPLHC